MSCPGRLTTLMQLNVRGREAVEALEQTLDYPDLVVHTDDYSIRRRDTEHTEQGEGWLRYRLARLDANGNRSEIEIVVEGDQVVEWSEKRV